MAKAQRPFYDLEKDKHWIDSVKATIGKHFEPDQFPNSGRLLLVKFKSCVALGQYYEALFDKNILNENRKAVFYYKKVTDFGRFPDDPKYFKALALRNNLCRKLAAVYFDGKGVKKNRKESLALALKGVRGCNGFFRSYSKKYFNCTGVFLRGCETSYCSSGSTFTFIINPFAEAMYFSMEMESAALEKIAQNFNKRLKADTAMTIYIVAYPEPSLRSQASHNNLVGTLKNFFVKKTKVDPGKIAINCEVRRAESDVVDIFFSTQ